MKRRDFFRTVASVAVAAAVAPKPEPKLQTFDKITFHGKPLVYDDYIPGHTWDALRYSNMMVVRYSNMMVASPRYRGVIRGIE